PTVTPLAFASRSVFRMPAASPAWKPQATLALLTIFKMAASSPMRQAPRLSPRSLFKSIFNICRSFSMQLAAGLAHVGLHRERRVQQLAYAFDLGLQRHAGQARAMHRL